MADSPHMAEKDARWLTHQIINMVGSVVGRAELLLERTPEGDPLRTDLEKMLRAGQEAANLTKMLADTLRTKPELVA